jgi:ketosteroid isomerase-like protein
MKHHLLRDLGFIILLVCLFASPAHPVPPAITVQDVVLLEQMWSDAVSRADVAALEKLLSDNVTYTHGSGTHETKREFISSIKTGERKYFPIILEDMHVRLFNDSAVVTGRYALKLISKGKEIVNHNRYIHVYARVGESMKLVAHQATNVPPPK